MFSTKPSYHTPLSESERSIMGNIFCCCLGAGGRRRRSNVIPPEATETTPLRPHPPKTPVNQSVSPDVVFSAGNYVGGRTII
ncbi:hypothetical protein F2Q69_00045761 [Brassica cretica]|uniref:Uncharacterized protein n=1 Tax=Brassica cretica TaxID=69181 RepID=A0A8S9NH70_BRACR|nr:hypothetical protein F2Q69_00045761 [Brassica cretica]